ncbi:MAG: response regulator [Lentisphaerae bacterium]|mgnify:CR=1 FL=1|nr:response regulator [Lentisphaerota bacterium]MBT4819577.1 response regulator [Lentisphaerota bacterium]MBT5609665.1 response regulator [Lentisphaerota bacterium]MBT7841387.1 response regulator [Lentisphaerota bacterium]
MSELRILVVDDELGMRLGVKRALNSFTFSLPDIPEPVSFITAEAGDGQEAREELNAHPPDILLLDHKLPDTTGLEILQELTENPRDLLTIMITAYASLETAVVATRRGAFDFLAKPFTPEELRSAVRKTARHLLLQRQARKLEEEKRGVRFEFISVLAHEMKSPLAAIEGYLRIVQERAAGDDPAVYERLVDRSLDRIDGMRKLILDLLDLTAIESGQKRRELADVDLAEALRQTVANFEMQASERAVNVKIRCPDTLPLLADRSEIQIVFNNLVSNAIKYNREGGRVTATLELNDDGAALLQVTDTGIGLTPEEAERLFADFVRIKNAKTRTIQGTGLGLSTVKKIATLYDGNAGVTSVPGEGSTFWVTLNSPVLTQEPLHAS